MKNIEVLKDLGLDSQRLRKYLVKCKGCGKTREVYKHQILNDALCMSCRKRQQYKEGKIDYAMLAQKHKLSNKPHKNNLSTGIKGVYFNDKTRLYRAYITLNGKSKYVGSSKIKEKAIEKRRLAEEIYYKEN